MGLKRGILIVDDEPELTAMLDRLLTREGFAVATARRGGSALELAAEQEPDLIVADVNMPEMDGFEFRREYRKRHPQRRTPFVFLSALGDSGNVVQGLDSGADDYLVKPVASSVLVAKIRSILRRTESSGEARFQGDLDRLPLASVLQYCEQRGLTGSVQFATSATTLTIPFEAGRFELDDATSDLLTELMDAPTGSFVIRSCPIRFDGIAEARSEPDEAPLSKTALPMGRLSGVEAGSRLLQLQTEYEPMPANRVVTVVILDGRVLTKRETAPPQGGNVEAVRSLIDSQHAEMEQLVRDKMSTFQPKPAPRPPEPELDKSALWKQGLLLYREGKLSECVERLERALALDPSDTLLRGNLDSARRRLEKGSSGGRR